MGPLRRTKGIHVGVHLHPHPAALNKPTAVPRGTRRRVGATEVRAQMVKVVLSGEQRNTQRFLEQMIAERLQTASGPLSAPSKALTLIDVTSADQPGLSVMKQPSSQVTQLPSNRRLFSKRTSCLAGLSATRDLPMTVSLSKALCWTPVTHFESFVSGTRRRICRIYPQVGYRC